MTSLTSLPFSMRLLAVMYTPATCSIAFLQASCFASSDVIPTPRATTQSDPSLSFSSLGTPQIFLRVGLPWVEPRPLYLQCFE